MEEPRDLILRCIDCGRDYVLGAGEIEFYKSKEFHLPKRCSECRRKRRQEGKEQDSRHKGRE